MEDYAASVAPLRAEWAECVGLFSLAAQPEQVTLTPYCETASFSAYWIVVPMTLEEDKDATLPTGRPGPTIHAARCWRCRRDVQAPINWY